MREQENNLHKRILYLDAIRVLACLLVCVIHSPLPTNGTGSIWISLYNYLSAPCIGLFFMVSGALRFPVNLPLKTFLKRRASRIMIPLGVWSIISVSVYVILGQISIDDGIWKILKIPFFPVEGVYWFMYTILGLYLFAPLLSSAIGKIIYTKYMLILWGMTLCLPYVNAFLPHYWDLRGDFYHPLGEFAGYMGYMVLGYYLLHTEFSWKTLFLKIIIPGFLLAAIIPAYFMNGRFAGVTNEMLYGSLTINVTGLCVVIFCLIKKATIYAPPPPNGGIYCVFQDLLLDISHKSFGIYLVHILIMRQFLWPLWQSYLPHMSYAIQIPVTAILTFIFSYLIIKLISFIPKSKYIF